MKKLTGLARLARVAFAFALCTSVFGQSTAESQQQLIQELLSRLDAQDARIQALEKKLAGQAGESVHVSHAAAASTPPVESAAAAPAPTIAGAPGPVLEPTGMSMGGHDHSMSLPGGPELKMNGFGDFNFGVGPVSDPSQLPSTTKSAFRVGEIDLFLSSKVSDHWSAVGEVVFGAGLNNEWGADIERLQLTYKASEYFSISGGRYHTAIGYYNTAFHHGTWFQTAQGRPFMYYFEDAGGLLPVHNVGLTATGLVPGTGNLGLHWIAEIGNGRSADRNGSAVQNTYSDHTFKAVNFAAYMQPKSGLTIGGSFYTDRPAVPGVGRVTQRVSSGYVVYGNSRWESLNEFVWQSYATPGATYGTPMGYTQFSRRMGVLRPYVRYQYVDVPTNDPVSTITGRYTGPSVGMRVDIGEYAAFKVQYNRLLQRGAMPAGNGLNAQVSFAF